MGKKKKHQKNPHPKPLPPPKDHFLKANILVLIGLAVVICMMRLHTYNEPFERDIASHSVIAQELLNGRHLYSDLWDSKPPAIFVTYAVFNFIFGMGPLAVYFLGITAAILTLIGVYKVGAEIAGTTGGLWSAAFWTFICSDLWMWANQPNIEVCINACLVWAFYLLISARVDQLQWIRWMMIGVLFGLATLYKPVAIVFAVLISAVYLCCHFRSLKEFKMAFARVCLIGVGGGVFWLFVFGYFAATKRLEIFYETLFDYAGYYAQSRGGNIYSNIARGFSVEKLFSRPMKSTPVLVVLTVAGVLLGLLKGCRKQWIVLFSFLLAAPIAISLPGRFYAHYYQLWLVPLAVGSGCFIGSLKMKDRVSTLFFRNLIGSISLLILMVMVLGQYKYSPDQWSTQKYGPQFVHNKKVALELKKRLKPDETMYVWGVNPELYFWTHRQPPTGVIWSTDLVEGPLAEEHTKRALRDLERVSPKLFVINNRQMKTPKDHPVIQWALKNYVPISGNPQMGLFYVLVKKNDGPQ